MRIQELSCKWYIYGGGLAGIAFAALFVRLPHWVGDIDDNRVALIYGIFIALFAYAGARLGASFYNKLREKENLKFQQHAKAIADAAENEERRRIANEQMVALYANPKR